MNMQRNTARVLIFIVFVLVTGWIVVLAVKQSGTMETNPTAGGLLANYIIITLPALGNIFTRLVTREGWGNLWLRPNFKRGWRFYLAAWLLPLLAVLVGSGLFYLIFPQTFDPNLGQVRKSLAAIPDLAAQPWLGLLIIFIQIMLLSMLINGIVSIGEEFGWRAYLLQKLMPLTGARSAALLTGLVWGLWHYPLFFLGGTLTLPFALLYLVFTSSLSVLLSWVTLRSGSVWTASIGHGMINGVSALPMMVGNGAANPLLGPGPTGLVGILGYLALALVLLFHRGAFSREPQARSEKSQAASGVRSA